MKILPSKSFDTAKILRRTLATIAVMAFTYGSAAHASWINVYDDVYIDLSSKGTMGLDQVTINVLQDYEEISSAMMFGLSEVDRAIFDCRNSKYKSNGITWYNGRMGKGGTTKKFGPDNGWTSIPFHYIKLFAQVCAPSS